MLQTQTPTPDTLPPTPKTTFAVTQLAKCLAYNVLIERVYYAKSPVPMIIERLFNDGVSRREGAGSTGVKACIMAPPDLANAFTGKMTYGEVLREIDTRLREFELKVSTSPFRLTELKNLWGRFAQEWTLYGINVLPKNPEASDMLDFVKVYNLTLASYVKTHDRSVVTRQGFDEAATLAYGQRCALAVNAMSDHERAVLFAAKHRTITDAMAPYVKTLQEKLILRTDNNPDRVIISVPGYAGSKSYDLLYGAKGGTLDLFEAANPSKIDPAIVDSYLEGLTSNLEDVVVAEDAPNTVAIKPTAPKESREDVTLGYWNAFMTSVLEKVGSETWDSENPVITLKSPLWDHNRDTSVRRIFNDMNLIVTGTINRNPSYVLRGTSAFFAMPKTVEGLKAYVQSYTPASGSVYQEFLDFLEVKTRDSKDGLILGGKDFVAALRHRNVTGSYDLDNLRTIGVLRGNIISVEQGVTGVFSYRMNKKDMPLPAPDPVVSEAPSSTPQTSMDTTPMNEARRFEKTPQTKPPQVLMDPTLQDIRTNAVYVILELLCRQSSSGSVSYPRLVENTKDLVGGEDALWDITRGLIDKERIRFILPYNHPPVLTDKGAEVCIPRKDLGFRLA